MKSIDEAYDLRFDGSFDEKRSYVAWADGRPDWYHICKSGDWSGGPLSTQWTWDESTDTVNPSLACSACGKHGWWENGLWRDV